MPRAWMVRFPLSVAEYFEAVQWEAQNRARGQWPEPATYMHMRLYTGALYTALDLVEWTAGFIMPIAQAPLPEAHVISS